jgi:hypothetical protein
MYPLCSHRRLKLLIFVVTISSKRISYDVFHIHFLGAVPLCFSKEASPGSLDVYMCLRFRSLARAWSWKNIVGMEEIMMYFSVTNSLSRKWTPISIISLSNNTNNNNLPLFLISCAHMSQFYCNGRHQYFEEISINIHMFLFKPDCQYQNTRSNRV